MFKASITKFSVKILLLILLLVLTLMASKGAFGAIATKHHDNGIGFVMQQDNPLTYVEGVPVNASLVGDRGINLRIQPRGVYQLYTQEILFCDRDEVIEKFDNASGVLVLTYDRIAHRTIEGIGCHDLVYVDEVKGK